MPLLPTGPGRAPAADVVMVGVVVLASALCLFYLWVDDQSVRVLVNQVSIATAVLGLAVAVVLARPERRLLVAALLAGTVLFAVAEAATVSVTVDGVAPYPHRGEPFAAVGTVLYLLGVLMLVGRRPRLSGQERLDIGIGATCVVLFAALAGLVRIVGSGSGWLLSGAFLLFAVVLVSGGILAVSRPETTRAGMWCVVACLGLIGADAGFFLGTADGQDVDGRLSDVGYVVARAAMVALALSLGKQPPHVAEQVGRRRVLVAGAFALLVPTGALVGAETGAVNPVWLTALAGCVPVVLLTWRAVLSVDGLARVAGQDHLTGLVNRRAFHLLLEQQCAQGPAFVLLSCDLDGFKTVNDAQGHAAGDAVLVAVSRALRDSTPDGTVVARLGGDEFALLVPGEGGPAPVRAALLEQLRPRLAVLTADHPGVGVSVGTTAGRRGSDPAALLAAADASMYADKRSSRRTPADA